MRRINKAAAAPVGVLSKVLRIFEAIHASPFGLGLKAISDATGIHKSTAHRFVKHLERERYLICTEEGTYLIGPRFAQLTTQVNPRAALQAVARPVLSQLWKSTQETVNLAVLDQDSVLYTDVIESPHEFRLSSRVGTRRTLPATALGKAMAAFLSKEQAERTLHSHLKASSITCNFSRNWPGSGAKAMRWTTKRQRWEPAVWPRPFLEWTEERSPP